jgi:bifunctional DNase/RNase
MIPVKVEQLFLSNMGFVVLLKSAEDERALPIFIGAAEAQAIAIQINGVEMPRPLTHDLLKNLLDFLECRLIRVEVCDLKNDTFYARLVLDRDGEEVTLDSRPSDAVALALRFQAPIFVARAVMDQAGRTFDKDAAETPEAEGTKPTPHKKNLTPLDLLKLKLDKAVEEERYEDAARFRDEIKRMEQSGN